MSASPSIQRFPRTEEIQIDPYEEGRFSYEAQVPITEAEKLIVGNANPRNQNTSSAIPKEIRDSLEDTPKVFHLKNRGIWIAPKKAEYDNQTGLLTLFCPQSADDKYGAVDGGHTLKVIQEYLTDLRQDDSVKWNNDGKPNLKAVPFVTLHIRVGVEDILPDMVSSLNRSAQLKEYTLANYVNEFEQLKDLLIKESFYGQIDWKENGQGEYDALTVIQRLTLFCNGLFPAKNGKHPVIAYSSKAKCLDLFKDKKEDYLALRPIIGDCFRLPDQIEKLLHKVSGSNRFGGFGFVKTLKKPRMAPSLKGYPENGVVKSWASDHEVSSGVVFLITAALRVLVRRKADGTVVGWREDPVKFFLKHGRELFEPVTEVNYDNPNALGKNHDLWGTVYHAAYQALHPED
ncbi:MAG: AIPR family protein [Acidobacteria bacterium]|nr:AIPR family protein [Acidobacteriota bacterium]